MIQREGADFDRSSEERDPHEELVNEKVGQSTDNLNLSTLLKSGIKQMGVENDQIDTLVDSSISKIGNRKLVAGAGIALVLISSFLSDEPGRAK